MREGTELLGGRYQVRGVLGYGGMAEVRDGWDTRLDRAVAIKLLSPAFGTQTDMLERFRAEARTAASLNHPNVVAVYDSGEHAGTPFIVMERLPGATLADEIAQGPVASARVRAVLDNVVDAVAAAHATGILHRDIKPGNILLTTPGGLVKVADFGISKTVDAAHTRTGEILGTMAYLSPERIAGAAAAPTDDVYAIGVVAYESLVGWPPFRGDNPGALARAIMDDQPPPVTAVRPDVDPALAAVVDRAMARNPQHRFPSATEMLAAVRGAPSTPTRPATKVLHAPLTTAPGSAVYVAPPRRAWSRQTKILVGAGAGAAALATTIVLLALDSPASRPISPEPVSTTVAVTTPPVSTSTPPPALPAQNAPTPPSPPGKAKPGNEGHGNGKKEKR
jgi:serine/threonine protein kinase